jgi:hypothetical protein
VGAAAERTDSVKDRLRKQLDYRYREVVERSGIDAEVAAERGYYLEKTKAGMGRLGFTRRSSGSRPW